MKTKLILVLLCISCGISGQVFLNLDFEYANPDTGQPKNWFVGGAGYNASLDSATKHNGNLGLKIQSNNPSGNQFGVCTGYFPIEYAKGKEIEFSGWIKTKELTDGYAGLWWRVDGSSGVLGFDNMYDRGISGTTDWQKVSIKMKVDPGVTNINYGGLFVGKGTTWFDNFEITIDGVRFTEEAPIDEVHVP